MSKSSKTLSRIAWLGFALTILYVTLWPFEFHASLDYFHARLHHADWFPFSAPIGYHMDKLDDIDNVILFMPFGFLAYWSFGRKSRLRRVALVFVGSFFSASIEFTQLFIQVRDTSLSDLTCNTLGTALGIWLASRASRE